MEASPIATAVLAVGLAIIMFSLGTSLTVADFRRVVTQPRGVAVGMVNLVLVAPLLAFGMAELFGLDPILAAGLVLLGAAPGGALANLMTHLARADTALSVTMTGVSSAISVVTVPLYLSLAASHFGAEDLADELSMPRIVARVLLGIAIPLGLGMWLAARRPHWVAARARAIRNTSIVTFAFLVTAAIVSQSEMVFENFGPVFAAALALNLAAMSISYTVARLVRLDARQSTAIAIELGVHNAALAVAIGASLDEQLAVPAAVYSSFMVITAGVFARLMYKRNLATVS
jgi:BASS family bile acid:Na+ symporter